MMISKAKNYLMWALLCASSLMSVQAQAICWSNCDAYKTKYPIVLVHGVAGFNSIFGIDYFYGVRTVSYTHLTLPTKA